MAKLKPGQIVHIDTDNKEWGRVATDGEVMGVFRNGRDFLINAYSIRANIIVPVSEISIKENA